MTKKHSKGRVRKFIARAIKHPGELTRFAVSEKCLTERGTIDMSCIKGHIDSLPRGERRTHLTRAFNLARTLGKLRRRR